MEVTGTVSLDSAKSSFLSLLSSVEPSEAGNFVDWVVQCCFSNHTNGDRQEDISETCRTSEEEKLTEIIKDIKTMIPVDGIFSSEKICLPEGKVIIIDNIVGLVK